MLVLYGNTSLYIEGIVNAKGEQKQKKSDWAKDENVFMDIAAEINKLEDKGFVVTPVFLVNPDRYL